MKLKFLVPVIAKTYNPNPLKTTEIIQDELGKVGIKIKIVFIDSKSLYKKNNGEYDMILDGWLIKNNDPDRVFRPLLSCQKKNFDTNWNTWCNQYFDNILNKPLTHQNIRFRTNYYYQAQLLVNTELPILTLAYSLHVEAYRHNIISLLNSSCGNSYFANVYHEKSSNIIYNY
ncbi:MAG: ABC transporter substrate-binding protein [Arsenophonus sp.]|nr:MAG: ABC transporter substrate-binding protein [Arsenophonus sp.]